MKYLKNTHMSNAGINKDLTPQEGETSICGKRKGPKTLIDMWSDKGEECCFKIVRLPKQLSFRDAL